MPELDRIAVGVQVSLDEGLAQDVSDRDDAVEGDNDRTEEGRCSGQRFPRTYIWRAQPG